MNRFNNVIFGQKVFLLNEQSEILVLKRANTEVYNDYWDVPGGKLEDGTDLSTAIIREVKEETNLELKRIVVVLSTSKFAGIAADAPLIFRNIYLATAEGNVKLSQEHSEFRWVPAAEISSINFPPDPDYQAAVLKIPEIMGNLDLSKKYSLVF